MLDDKDEREEKGETYETLYGEADLRARDILPLAALVAQLPSPQPGRTIRPTQLRMVIQARASRPPPAHNPLQGLLLLRDAWRDYDVSMHLADKYKRACKTIFALQLVFSWLVVVGAGLDPISSASGRSTFCMPCLASAVAFSILVSLDGMLNPKARWRQLRSGAISLQSIIWKYRTRTGRSSSTRASAAQRHPRFCSAPRSTNGATTWSPCGLEDDQPLTQVPETRVPPLPE